MVYEADRRIAIEQGVRATRSDLAATTAEAEHLEEEVKRLREQVRAPIESGVKCRRRKTLFFWGSTVCSTNLVLRIGVLHGAIQIHIVFSDAGVQFTES